MDALNVFYDNKALGCFFALVNDHYQRENGFKNLEKTVMSEIEKNVELLGNKIMQGIATERIIDEYTTWLKLEDRAWEWLYIFSY